MLLLLTLMATAVVQGFPDGAPIDACIREIPNTPYHKPFTPQTQPSPYVTVATNDTYVPGQTIQVFIYGQDTFRGFFVQARDPYTDKWIGEFLPAEDFGSVHPECSTITHNNPYDKDSVSVVWKAPARRSPQDSGNVIFRVSIVKKYDTFWTNRIADVAIF